MRRFSLGSFSESVRVFEPEKLREVITQLAGEMRPVNADPRLKTHLDQALVLADGTVLDAITTVARAAWLPLRDGTTKHACGEAKPPSWKLHVQFDFDSFLPTDVELTDARNSGKSDEKNVLRKKLKRDCCYVMDRWFGQFKLFNDIVRAGSSYVCRVKENSVFEVIEERLLEDEALQAGVVRDATVRMGLSSKPGDGPDHPMRLVVIAAEPHEKRGGRRGKTAGPGNKGTIVIATNLLDVPAEIIALIYHHRRAIEVFFRVFKQILRRASPPPRLPSPAKPAAGGDYDPSLLRDHRLHVDQPVDRGQADEADGGNAGLVLRRRRQRRRDDATHRAAAKNKGMNTPG